MKHYFKKVLSALALAFVVIVAAGAVKASAATLTYDPINDTIKADGACVVYVLKNAEETTIKASAKYIELADQEVKPLSEMGIKDGTAVYFYIAAAALEEDLEEDANFVIDALAAYKAVGKIDYTQADSTEATAIALSATVTDKEKKEISDAAIIWKGEDDDAYVDNAGATAFTGSKLAAMLENGGTITIKVKGNGTTRTSKAFKVKIAKQAKLPSVKLDVKKNTFSIKNGFDFAKATKAADETYTAGTWYTVLPYLRDANTKLEAASIVATTSYLPLAKNDKNAKAVLGTEEGAKVAYTSYKFKALRLDTLINTLNTEVTEEAKKVKLSADFNVAVRKSATEKKPASQVAYFDIAAQKGAPQMYTVANISTCTTIATADELKFKATQIVNYTNVWAGIGEDVDPAEGATVDDTAKKYEMAVVKAADYYTVAENGTISLANKIDWSTVSWKTFKKGTSISDKTKTKYYVVGATNPTEAILKAGTTPADEENPYGDAATLILIRRAGVKGKTISESVLASELLVTYVYKDTNKKYNWEIAKTTTGQVLVGEAAYHYALTLKTWQKDTDGNYAYLPSEVIEGYQKLSAATVITVPFAEGQVAGATFDGGTYDTDKKVFTIAAPSKAGVSLTAGANVDTEVTVNITYVGVEGKTTEKLSDKHYLGVGFAAPTVEGYTVKTVTSEDKVKYADEKIIVNEGSEVTITVTYEETT